MDASQITSRSEEGGGMGSRSEVIPIIQRLFGGLSLEQKVIALPILAQHTLPGSAQLLGQHGFEFRNGTFVPVGVLDAREAKYLPTESRAEISGAFDRLVNGDESGAITKACGAVDSLARAIYEKNGWPNLPDSFQAKVNTVVKRLKIFETMRVELDGLSMKPEDAATIIEEMRKTTCHAAQALQVIRRAMGDVHGTRPALTRCVYESIKWASAICALLEDQV